MRIATCGTGAELRCRSTLIVEAQCAPLGERSNGCRESGRFCSSGDGRSRGHREVGPMRDAGGPRLPEDPIQLMAAIVTSAGDAIVGRGLDGTILTWNESAERLFGYRPDEMVGSRTDRMIPAEDRPEAARLFGRAATGYTVELAHAVRIARDGRRVDVGVTISPIRDSSERVIGTSTIFRDITEQLRIQEELRLRERLAAAERLAAGLA